jgi:hypothetical protein
MATTVHEAGRRIALDEIRVPENVRSLDDLHVQALAGSIALQGMPSRSSSATLATASSSSPAFTGSPPHGPSVSPTSLS